jgi:hypothetical protein
MRSLRDELGWDEAEVGEALDALGCHGRVSEEQVGRQGLGQALHRRAPPRLGAPGPAPRAPRRGLLTSRIRLRTPLP